jgi:membrane protease YdiL (CAAX protease family)
MKSTHELTKAKEAKKQVFLRVILFYLIAFTVSNLFRFDLFHLENFFESLPLWTMIFQGPIQALGVLLGAIIAIKLLRKHSHTEFSLWGSSKKWSLIMSLFPVLLLLILGVTNTQVDSHYYGFIAGISTLIYCLFEEYGWRGYLEEELKYIPEFTRVMIIAGLWYLWHLNFLRTTDLVSNIIMIASLILGTWGIGKIIRMTQSVLAAACIHMTINMVLFNGFIKNGLDGTDKIIVLSVLIPVWILILSKWKKEKNQNNEINEANQISDSTSNR